MPADAAMTQPIANHCAALRRSPRRAKAASAAMTGSRLISTPKVFRSRRRRATISSE